jgi:zinc protease
LKDHAAALQRVDPDDVLEAGARWLAPSLLTPVLVGDAEKVSDSVAALFPLETQ